MNAIVASGTKRLMVLWTIALIITVGCASGPKLGANAPLFEATDATGSRVAAHDFAEKIAVFYFWATWCPPCVTASPAVQEIHERYLQNQRVQVLAVHFNDVGAPLDYVEKHSYTFSMIPNGQSIVEAYGVKKIPTIVVVSRQGEVAYSQVGFAKGDEAKVVAAIEASIRR